MNVNYKLVNITFKKAGSAERKQVTKEITYDLYCDLNRRLGGDNPTYTVDHAGNKDWFIESLKIVR